MQKQPLLPYLSCTPEQIGWHPTSFEAPAQARIGTVTLQVTDLARSLAFYQG